MPQSGTSRENWFTVDGLGDEWYVIDRRDNSKVCGCKHYAGAVILAKELNDGWLLEYAIMHLAGVIKLR